MTVLSYLSLLAIAVTNYNKPPQQIAKNGMTVSIEHRTDSIWFELEAPTKGWIAIGFNDTAQLKGTYLIMGAIHNGTVTIEEHHTFSPGDYRSFSDLGIDSSVTHKIGIEKNGRSKISFQLPVKSAHNFGKDLIEKKDYTLLMAFSREDDFRHHSSMRTSVNIKL